MTVETKGNIVSRKKNKHRRRESIESDDFLIEELFPDDMAYDADIEVVQPNQYEEADSESDPDTARNTRMPTIDEELAERMRRLGGEHGMLASHAQPADRGRKRTSIELDDRASNLNTPMSPGLEVHEMFDGIDQPSPAKRRKRRSKHSDTTQHHLRNHIDAWTDSSERAGANPGEKGDGSSSRTTPSETPQREDVEEMDIT